MLPLGPITKLSRASVTPAPKRKATSAEPSKTSKKSAPQFDWTLIPEYPIASGKKTTLRVDGALIDAFNLPRAWWEAKDTKDSLRAEAEKKFALGYPRTNILFPNSAVCCPAKRPGNQDRLTTMQKLGAVISYLRRVSTWSRNSSKSLVVRVRSSKNLKSVARVSLALIFAAIILGWGWSEASKPLIILELPHLPQRYTDAGLTPEILAREIKEKLEYYQQSQIPVHIQKDGKRQFDSFALVSDHPYPDIKIPKIGLSIQDFVDLIRFLRKTQPKHLVGEVVISGSEAQIKTHVTISDHSDEYDNISHLSADDEEHFADEFA